MSAPERRTRFSPELVEEPEERCPLEEQRERWERKRLTTAKALIQTERQYLEQLELITRIYHDVFRARCGRLKIAETGICGHIPEILVANRLLLSAMDLGDFGSGFENFTESLSLYKKHADSIEPTVQVLQYHTKKKKKSFMRFRKLQESRSELKGRPLEQLLELPLLRVLEYRHYLRDLAENSRPGASDFAKLTSALHAVSDVCQYIDTIAQDCDNERHLRRVQSLIKGRRVRILIPGRRYIREGWLSLVPQSGEEVKQRMFFLFSDVLAVTSPCHPLHPINCHKFTCRSLYPLRECHVERVLGHTQSQGGLISVSFAKEKLLLMSTDQTDINDWYKCLVGAVRKFHSNSRKNTKTAPGDQLVGEEEAKAQALQPKVTKRSWDREVKEGRQAQRCPDFMSHEETAPKKAKIVNDRSLQSCPPADTQEASAGWSCSLL
uniref:Rho guanine nucleotide exchange factor 39 n=1 Tax=Xenopus laevis TaxID=8355 RepID=UPI00084D401A|nr:Rho guanine nucleotide exchange factor 39 [Xenopus laevis]